MGQEIQRVLLEPLGKGLRLIGGSALTFEGEHFYQGKPVTPELLASALSKDPIDLVLDFSSPDGNALLLKALTLGKVKNLHVLVGTTGLDAKAQKQWAALAKSLSLAVLMAPNTSIGVLVATKAALFAAAPLAKLGFDVEIVETHHRAKKDAPSGTAKFMAEVLQEGLTGTKIQTARSGARQAGEIGVHSVRGGGVFGEHEIRLLGDNEEITLKHRAFSRTLFASGALVLGRWLLQQKPGFFLLRDIQPEDLLA